MVEMTVGSRFWHKDKLCEVAETEIFRCRKCMFEADIDTCEKSKCSSIERHDGKDVYFKEVKE